MTCTEYMNVWYKYDPLIICFVNYTNHDAVLVDYSYEIVWLFNVYKDQSTPLSMIGS